MAPNKRIVLNILATYGRTLVGAVCGIFSTRWVLMALGPENFGLFGLIASLVIFVTFFNAQFSGALSRFYAFSIGKAKASTNFKEVLEDCRGWFSTGVIIHVILPLILVAIGYPIGRMAITEGWLSIPVEKVNVCVWLWRFAMISCFVGMVNVPFQAMYTAKQYIAELTVYSMVQVVVRTGFIYYMTTVPKDWLYDYGLAVCLISIVPQLIICLRATRVFSECRFRVWALADLIRIKDISKYVWWQIFVGVGYLARHQCLEVVVNKFFGPKVNAAYTVGATVGGEAAALTGALNGAFGPVVTTAYGEGDIKRAKAFAFRACKFGTLLTLLFAIPMALEIKEVLLLWLKTPPAYAEGLCLCWLGVVIVEKFTLGQIQLVNASGDIAKFSLFRSLACFTAIPFSVATAYIWPSVYAIGLSLLATTLLAAVSDAIVARLKVEMGIRKWLFGVILPLGVVAFASAVVGAIPRFLLDASFLRVVATTAATLFALLPLSWFLLFDNDERAYSKTRILVYVAKFRAIRT